MKNMKKLCSVILAVIMVFLLAIPAQAEAAVKISKAKATMEVDSTLKLKISGTKSKATWKSNKSSIASVNTSGTVTAKKEGSATITAVVSGKKYTCVITVVNSNKATNTVKTYGIGDTWTVDGLWTLTFDSVNATDERNKFSDKTPDQVVILNYTYENIGYKDELMDLYVASTKFKVVDAKGEVAETYPAGVTTYPKETPIGAKCVGAQEAYGLNNESKTITVYVEMYDNNYNKHTATFNLKID